MKKIVIIEDEQALRTALSEKLTKEGFEVFQAGNGQQGMDLIKRHHPALVILDLLLPVKSGEIIAYELRDNPEMSDIPIYMISNISDLETYSKGLRAKIDLYDIKSEVTIGQIADKVKRITKI